MGFHGILTERFLISTSVHAQNTAWKNRKCSIEKTFVKTFYITVEWFHEIFAISKGCTVWKLWKFTVTLFLQKFRESIVFTKVNTKELISRNFFWVTVNFSFFHTHFIAKNFVNVTVLPKKLLNSWFDGIFIRQA